MTDIMVRADSNARFSVFEYLYRDAGNYKAFGELLLTGAFTDGDAYAIDAACDSPGLFIAEQIGVPALYHELYQFSGGPTEDDHVFHEVGRLREARPDEYGSVPWGAVSDLTEQFRRVDGKWDYSLSPHWRTSHWG